MYLFEWPENTEPKVVTFLFIVFNLLTLSGVTLLITITEHFQQQHCSDIKQLFL